MIVPKKLLGGLSKITLALNRKNHYTYPIQFRKTCPEHKIVWKHGIGVWKLLWKKNAGLYELIGDLGKELLISKFNVNKIASRESFKKNLKNIKPYKKIKKIIRKRSETDKIDYLKYILLLLSFLDPDRNIGYQQCQLSTELLTGPVVSNQARFCLDSCTPFPKFVFMSHKVFPFFSKIYNIHLSA